MNDIGSQNSVDVDVIIMKIFWHKGADLSERSKPHKKD